MRGTSPTYSIPVSSNKVYLVFTNVRGQNLGEMFVIHMYAKDLTYVHNVYSTSNTTNQRIKIELDESGENYVISRYDAGSTYINLQIVEIG